MTITCRFAKLEEAKLIVPLILKASKISALIYNDLSPGERVVDALLKDILKEDAKCYYKRCLVALYQGEVVGVANLYPSEEHLLTLKTKASLSQESVEYLTPLFSYPLPHSFYISSLASSKKGGGTALIKKIAQMAVESHRKGITLHCWNDNLPAMNFYQKLSFIKIKEFDLGSHPLIPYNGHISLLYQPG